MSYRVRELDAEHRTHLALGLFGAVAIHLLVAIAAPSFLSVSRTLPPDTPFLGYRGPMRPLEELEVLEPNSVQSYFYQRRQQGRLATQRYRIVEPVVLEPGPKPEPLPRPNPKPEQEQLDVAAEDLELIEPLKPLHKEISFSQDFVILKQVKPEYPEYEKARSIEGLVIVQFYVTPEGKIEDERVAQSSTRPAGASPRAFELAALEAVRQWKVAPPMRNGQPHGGWMEIHITFDLIDVKTNLP